MNSTFVKGVVVGAVVSAITLVSSAAVAGTGVGQVFNLGVSNRVNATTTLAGSTAGKQLSVVNTSNQSGATGIAVTVQSGKPPLAVNSSTQVKNLNANYLQGKPAGAFVQGTGTVAQSGLITVPWGTEVFLGAVPNIGGLWGECANGNAAGEKVVLKTNNALPTFLFTNSAGDASVSNGGGTFNVTRDSTGALGSTQIASGTHTATITVDGFDSLTQNCYFSAQSVTSG